MSNYSKATRPSTNSIHSKWHSSSPGPSSGSIRQSGSPSRRPKRKTYYLGPVTFWNDISRSIGRLFSTVPNATVPLLYTVCGLERTSSNATMVTIPPFSTSRPPCSPVCEHAVQSRGPCRCISNNSTLFFFRLHTSTTSTYRDAYPGPPQISRCGMFAVEPRVPITTCASMTLEVLIARKCIYSDRLVPVRCQDEYRWRSPVNSPNPSTSFMSLSICRFAQPLDRPYLVFQEPSDELPRSALFLECVYGTIKVTVKRTARCAPLAIQGLRSAFSDDTGETVLLIPWLTSRLLLHDLFGSFWAARSWRWLGAMGRRQKHRLILSIS